MDAVNYIIDHLPIGHDTQLLESVYEQWPEELGGEHIIYKRASIETGPDIKRTMTPDDWEELEFNTKRHWGAECYCTACGREFEAGYFSDGIILRGNDDFDTFIGWISEDDENAVKFSSESEFFAPCCGVSVKPLKYSERDEAEYQLMVNFPTVIGEYGGIVTWMFSRWIDGIYFEGDCRPLEATFVVDGKCVKLTRYSSEFTDDGPPLFREETSWHIAEGLDAIYDISQARYRSREAYCETKFGAATWDDYVDFTGTSAEKTGVEDWILQGRSWPVMYLNMWNEHPNIENLVKAGFGGVIEDIVCEELLRAAEYDMDPVRIVVLDFVDWNEVKPHRMLGIRKEDLDCQLLRSWGAEDFRNYKEYNTRYSATIKQFDDWRRMFKSELWRLVHAGLNMDKTAAYLCKQNIKTGLGLTSLSGLMIDYRAMLPEEATTEVELWPPNIKTAHDRAMTMKAAAEDRTVNEGFARIAEEYSSLCWTDGELEILIPETATDLKLEGKVLKHCVGGYTKRHVNGEPIFFVRHHRRPERSYFTLNIDMRGNAPREIQLHGYGNENKGSKHWGIPREVREFVDRWERDVLLPWFMNNKKRKDKAA